MTIKISIISFALVSMLVLTIGIASAQTMVAGKIYDKDYSNIIEGASVSVTCKTSTLITTSLNDGTYAVRFEQSQCDLGDLVKISASKGTLTGTGSETMAVCEGTDCPEEYFVVINAAMKEPPITNPPTSNGGASGSSGKSSSHARIYICGNGKCDSGETANTCAKDCVVTNTNQTNNNSNNTEPEENTTTETITLSANEPASSKLTGAFVAIKDAFNLPLSIALLSFLIILFIGHKIIQTSKRSKRKGLFA